MKRGIDVSAYQGKIDFLKVKPYIDFVIIRCAYGNNEDVYFKRNSEICESLNIPYGVYLYSYATNLDEAKMEVDTTLRVIKDKKLEYPIFLDVESKRQRALRKKDLTEIVNYYCNSLEDNGYYVGIYGSLDAFKSYLSSEELDKYDRWVAFWSDAEPDISYGMWQKTDYEEMPGIEDRVDGDITIKDYPKIIKDKNLNHLEDNEC